MRIVHLLILMLIGSLAIQENLAIASAHFLAAVSQQDCSPAHDPAIPISIEDEEVKWESFRGLEVGVYSLAFALDTSSCLGFFERDRTSPSGKSSRDRLSSLQRLQI